jgi:hypothetical protein
MTPDEAAHARRDDRRLCLRLWLLAAIVRLLYLAAARPLFTLYYWDAASNLLQEGSLSFNGVKTAMLEPLYPLFLAAARSVIGDRPFLVQALQALVASAGAIYLYKVTVVLTARKRAGIAAAALFAVYPLLVHHSVDGTESALLTTLLIIFVYQFVAMRSVMGAAATGGWLGLAILTRSMVLPLLVLAPLIAAAKSGPRGITIAWAAVLVLAPYAIRSYTLNGAILPTRTGINLFIANCKYSAGVIADYGPDVLQPYAESRLAAEGLANLPQTPLAEQQLEVAYRRLAFAEIHAHPFDTLWLKIQNVGYLFSPVLVPYRITTGATRIRLGQNGQSAVDGTIARPLVQQIAYSCSYVAVAVLAVVGVCMRRHDLGRDAMLWCVLLTFTAVYAAFFPSTRYRAPADFVMLFYAGIAVETWIDCRQFISRGPNAARGDSAF